MSKKYWFGNWAVVLLCFLLLRVFAGRAQSTTPHVEIDFQIKNAGLNVSGSFRKAGAQISWAEAGTIPKAIEAWAEAASIDTGISSRDRHLQKEEYFHAEKFPRLMVHMKASETKAEGLQEGWFVVNIKGVSREIKIPFRHEQSTGGQTILNATFTVNRLDFGVGKKSWILADEVQVKVKIQVPTQQTK